MRSLFTAAVVATALTVAVQEAANAASIRFVQQVGDRFDYGLNATETGEELFLQGSTFEISGFTGLTNLETGGVFGSIFELDKVTLNSVRWQLNQSFYIASSPAEIDLSLVRFSIFSSSQLGNGSFSIDRIGNDAETISYTGALPVPNAIPTPALLPGLIGMGVAALRKKGQEEPAEQEA